MSDSDTATKPAEIPPDVADMILPGHVLEWVGRRNGDRAWRCTNCEGTLTVRPGSCAGAVVWVECSGATQ